MRRYNDLTPDEQQQALQHSMDKELELIAGGFVRFNDELNGNNVQATIDAAIEKARANQTPWFAHEYVWEARYNPGEGHITEDDGLWPVSKFIESLAICVVEDAWYPDPDEMVIRL